MTKLNVDIKQDKNYFIKRVVLFILVILGFGFNACALHGTYGIHDPSSIIKCGDTYWIFGTGNGIYSMYSRDLVKWTAGTTPFVPGTYPSWVLSYVPNFGGHYWAPECFYMNGKYYLYYSCSSWGSRNSCIGLLTNKTLDPASPDYSWKDEGMIIYSTESNNYNCIDPAVFRDDKGKIWMTFGSHWDGIKLVELDSIWGDRLNETIYSLASKGDYKAEASYVINHGEYYYLFVNHGQCCEGVESTYYITMGRSTSPTGPYLDKSGKDLYNGGGTTVLSTTGSFIGPGCLGYFKENNTEWITCHFYDGDNWGQATLCVARVIWDENGWPVITRNMIDNGTYSIVNDNSDLVWDISGSGEDRDPIIQNQYYKSPSQQWKFTSMGNGIYEISASESDLLARITDCMGNAGAKISINQSQPLSRDCEIWMIDRTNDERYIFTSLYGNKVIEVPESSSEEGIQLAMNNYSGAANQKWMIRDTSYAVFAAGPEISQGNIRIIPNPSPDGSFYIETSQSSGTCEVVIYSLTGQKLVSKELPVTQIINVNNTLIPGFYIVKIKINTYILTSKLTVN
jgi:arabinan endo-1,5-alpha-L-arabinosidase